MIQNSATKSPEGLITKRSAQQSASPRVLTPPEGLPSTGTESFTLPKQAILQGVDILHDLPNLSNITPLRNSFSQ